MGIDKDVSVDGDHRRLSRREVSDLAQLCPLSSGRRPSPPTVTGRHRKGASAFSR